MIFMSRSRRGFQDPVGPLEHQSHFVASEFSYVPGLSKSSAIVWNGQQIILEKLQQSYTNCQRGHGTQRQSQRLMPVKDKRTELQCPLSLSPASLTVCHNESNHSAGSLRTSVEPWIHPGGVRAPQDHSHPPGSDPVLMDDSSGMREGWAAPCLPLSLWCIHLQDKKHTHTHKKCTYIHTVGLWPCPWTHT